MPSLSALPRPNGQDINKNPLPSHNVAGPSINMTHCDDIDLDPSSWLLPLINMIVHTFSLSNEDKPSH